MKKVFIFNNTSKVLPVSPDTWLKYDNVKLYVPPIALATIGWSDSTSIVISDMTPGEADIVLTTEPLPVVFVAQLRSDAVVIGSLDPYWNIATIKALATQRVTTFALDLMIRSTKAQYMDVVSSQANLAGYRAVIEGAFYLNRSMPLMITTAGTLVATKVLVIGAGVAGLQAIATAKRLGAIVYAFDVRAVTKEQVESLGATFIDIEIEQQTGVYATTVDKETCLAQQQALAKILPSTDIVITTAQIPGKPAPIILTKELLSLMKRDAIIIDITTKHGGNCECYNVMQDKYPQILRYDNILNNIPKSASQLYAKNVFNFIKYLENFSLDSLESVDDEIIQSTLLTYKGNIMHQL